MKHISKIITVAMAALTIISCSSAAVGAAEVKPCTQIKVICQNGSCGDINKLIEKYCGKNCNLKDILITACTGQRRNSGRPPARKRDRSIILPHQTKRQLVLYRRKRAWGFLSFGRREYRLRISHARSGSEWLDEFGRSQKEYSVLVIRKNRNRLL